MVDYNIIAKSVDYYTKEGFSYIETPWTVTEDVSKITKPEGVEDWIINSKKKCLIASGEQGFLYLYLKGFLPKGRLQTVTPCFREDVFDITHRKYFIKNELIITDDVTLESLDSIVNTANNFFKSLGFIT